MYSATKLNWGNKFPPTPSKVPDINYDRILCLAEEGIDGVYWFLSVLWSCTAVQLRISNIQSGLPVLARKMRSMVKINGTCFRKIYKG